MAFAVEQASWPAPEKQQTERHLRLVGGTAVEKQVEVVIPQISEPSAASTEAAPAYTVTVEREPHKDTTVYSDGTSVEHHFATPFDENPAFTVYRNEHSDVVINHADNTHTMYIDGIPLVSQSEGAAGWTQ